MTALGDAGGTVDVAAVVLRDGTVAEVHPIEPSDAGALVRFHGTLSDETTFLRFFNVHPELSDEEVERFTNVDHERREALVAVVDGELAAVARLDRLGDAGDAEVAFVVADSLQGRGLGTALFHRLAARARDLGVRRFVAETLPHNRRMLLVFCHSGLPVATSFRDGVVHVTVDL